MPTVLGALSQVEVYSSEQKRQVFCSLVLTFQRDRSQINWDDAKECSRKRERLCKGAEAEKKIMDCLKNKWFILVVAKGLWRESREFSHTPYPESPKCCAFRLEEPVDHLPHQSLQPSERWSEWTPWKAHRSQGGEILAQLLILSQKLSESSLHWIWSGF